MTVQSPVVSKPSLLRILARPRLRVTHRRRHHLPSPSVLLTTPVRRRRHSSPASWSIPATAQTRSSDFQVFNNRLWPANLYWIWTHWIDFDFHLTECWWCSGWCPGLLVKRMGFKSPQQARICVEISASSVPPSNSAIMTLRCWWEDELPRERTDLLLSSAKVKKMESLTLYSDGCLSLLVS